MTGDLVVLAVFGLVYLGMLLGRLPGLKVDRAGTALVGAVVLVAAGRLTLGQAWEAVDPRTLALLLGLMVVSAQLRVAGFYAAIAGRLGRAGAAPPALLGLTLLAVGGLSAVLGNDIVCLAVAPVLVEGCAARGLDPVPFLLGLAAAANVGSAATLIGNPQNILVGSALSLSFPGYLADAGVPALLGLGAVWAVLVWQARGRWQATGRPRTAEKPPPLDRWQAAKGLVVVAFLVGAFLLTGWPRAVVGLGAGALLLLSRRTQSRRILALVDWQLLVLFAGLFVVNAALVRSGMLADALGALKRGGLDLGRPPVLFGASVVLSGLVSNVPAVMLLLPAARAAAVPHLAGAVLALSSTFAGNLVVVGSIANVIVVDAAGRLGVTLSWRRHLRAGLPVTLATLALAAAWLALRIRP